MRALNKKLLGNRKKSGFEHILPPTFFASDEPTFGVYERLITGVKAFDFVTGGGVPRGLFTHVFGPEQGGKSTICYQAIARAQEAGLVCVLIDAEHRASREWMEKQGVDPEKLTVVLPVTAEEGLQAIITLAEAADLIVLDSVPALATVAEKKRELTDESIALLARKLPQFFRLATPIVSASKCAIVLINQIRTDINSYGAPQDAPAGTALKHHASLKVQVRRGRTTGEENKRFRDDGKEIGYPMMCRVVKTSVSNPGLEASSDFYYDRGFDSVMDLFLMSELAGLITHSGAAYQIVATTEIPGFIKVTENLNLPKGRANVIEHLRGDRDLQIVLQRALDRERKAAVEDEPESSTEESS